MDNPTLRRSLVARGFPQRALLESRRWFAWNRHSRLHLGTSSVLSSGRCALELAYSFFHNNYIYLSRKWSNKIARTVEIYAVQNRKPSWKDVLLAMTLNGRRKTEHDEWIRANQNIDSSNSSAACCPIGQKTKQYFLEFAGGQSFPNDMFDCGTPCWNI